VARWCGKLRAMNKSATADTLDRNPDAPYHHGDLRRSLIEAGLELVKEGREWSFSLREVAKRAGVSHNAPYYHFADKRDLLLAVAVVGYETLTARIAEAAASSKEAKSALFASGRAYIQFGLENPGLYQLMFSAALNGPDGRPKTVADAGAATRATLEEILRRGARAGVFSSSLLRASELRAAAFTAWSIVHGFTMLVIEELPTPDPSIADLADKVVRVACRSFRR
jgi:AcrR family transcriptional regulator